MSSNLDRIVNITIELQSVVSSGASFDHVLLVGPAPAKPLEDVTIPDVGVYTDLTAVNEMGWVSEGDSADPVGIAARIAFSQSVKPSKIYIAVQKKDSGGSDLEKPNLTLSRAEGENGWYMALAAGIPEDDLEVMAEWTEAREKMFGYSYADPNDNPVSNTYYRTFGICYGDDTGSGDPYKHVAMAIRFLSYEAGSETWVNKSLASVSTSKFTGTEMDTIDKDPASYYILVGDTGLVQGGKVRAGEWIDVIRFRDWLKNDMQLRILNLLVKRPKVPYTDKGIGLVRNQMIASLKEGTRRGGIAEDQYNSDDELIPGFTTSVPLGRRPERHPAQVPHPGRLQVFRYSGRSHPRRQGQRLPGLFLLRRCDAWQEMLRPTTRRKSTSPSAPTSSPAMPRTAS